MAFDPLTGQWTPSWKTGSGFGDVPTASMGGESLADYIAERTPQEDWANLMADLPADPRWGRGLESLGGRMLGRYHLAEPYIGQGQADPDTSFARYMSDYGGAPSYGVGYGGLRARAGLAAQAARTPVSGSGAFVNDPIMRQYYGQFGAGLGGENVEAGYRRQREVATMLAQQRGPDLGAYRGRMGEAIQRAMSSMAASRLAAGAPKTDFLSWYLAQTAPADTTAKTSSGPSDEDLS